jgi:phosphoglycerate dehydrogenase-like enzyme
MPIPKVAIISSDRQNAETLIGEAPAEVEIVLIDRELPDEEKAPTLIDVVAIILHLSNISLELLRMCPNVKLIQTLSAGTDRYDVKAINEMGIPVATNGGANAIAVSEHTVALMIGLCRRTMLQWDRAGRQRKWREGLTDLCVTELTGKTVGIVGMGLIGKQVAQRLMGFETNTVYHNTVDLPDEVQRTLNARPVAFEELLQKSDIVSLHVPLIRRTRGMISDRELSMMKPTAYLVNTCRGRVVDEKALHRALTNRVIAGAGLDVLEEEPTPVDNPLFDLDNVLITPHMAGVSQETNLRAARFAYSNIMKVLAGQPPESLVTPED